MRRYNPIIGELTKQKAEEGITIKMIAWGDMTGNMGEASKNPNVSFKTIKKLESSQCLVITKSHAMLVRLHGYKHGSIL